jgi:RNA recognition motif-containing protein
MEGRKIFVGNLPPTSFTDKNLIDFFQKFGNVIDAFIIRDARSNVGRRCGFVTFESDEIVDQLKQLSSHHPSLKLKGNRFLRINDADPKRVNSDDTNVRTLIYEKCETENEIALPVDAASTTIDDLNDDCLLSIFSHFSIGYSINFERVCRRWQQLLRRRWTTMNRLPLLDFEFSFR